MHLATLLQVRTCPHYLFRLTRKPCMKTLMIAPSCRSAWLLYLSLLGCVSPSSSQTTPKYQASIASEYGYATGTHLGISTCGGTTYLPEDRTVYVTPLVLAELPLVKSNGTWQQGSDTEQVVESGVTYQFASTVSASGLATTYVTYAGPYGGPSYLVSGSYLEKLDLNTGMYSLHHDDYDEISGTCSGTAHNVDDITADLPVTLNPVNQPFAASLQIVNPAAANGSPLPLIASVPVETVASAPAAAGLAADGASAAALVYKSSSADPVTFTLSSSGPSKGIGGITVFSPDYLINPAPSTVTQYTDVDPINYDECTAAAGPNANNPPCIFVDLLYAPAEMPSLAYVGGPTDPFTLTVIAKQTASDGSEEAHATSNIGLLPPPLVLIHGAWSSGKALEPFAQWLSDANYPHQLVFVADYGATSGLSFEDRGTQQVLATTISRAIAVAAQNGVVAQKVDVFAHSMGGLVTRYLMYAGAPTPTYLPPSPIHQLITVGTPQDGSPFANFLEDYQNNKPTNIPQPFGTLCQITNACTLGAVLGVMGLPVGPAYVALEQGLAPYSQPYKSIVGIAPDPSSTGTLLNAVLNAYAPSSTVDGILGTPNDTIVPAVNQNVGAIDTATITNIVHTSLACIRQAVPLVGGLCADNTGETASSAVWNQAVYWLLGEGTGQAPISSSVRGITGKISHAVEPQDTTAPSPVFDLTGYTQVDASNVSISPASATVLTIGAATTIAATSSTKTISEVLLFQTVADPADIPVAYVTQSPFNILFTPTRLGSANFVAFAVFTDNTFAALPLSYTLQPSGSALNLTLDAPVGSLPIGLTTTVPAEAGFSNGLVDVTIVATYFARSGGTKVFSVGSNGGITTTGNGFDWLDVSYGGQTASAMITVGSCTYTLGPANQIIQESGGTATIQVTTQDGCSWTADSGGATWITLSNASGVGQGMISVSATSNNTGSQQTAFITVAGQDVAIVQPANACSYTLGTTQIQSPAVGTSGSIAVATSCPIIANSSQPWAVATALSSSVNYFVGANTISAPRNATITIGDQDVQVAQAGALVTPTVTVTPSASSITTAQSLTVTIIVSGGSGNTTPTGTVALTGGGFTSAATTLTSGSASISIVAGKLATGSDTVTVVYTPDSSSSSTYNNASGTASVTVATAPNPSFTVSGTPVTVTAGATTGNTSTITATPSNGFTGMIGLTCIVSGPSGATSPTCSLPASVSITGSTAATATLTIATSATTTAGAYVATVTGSSGTITETTAVNVTVTSSVSGGTFALTSSATITVSPGATTGNSSKITVTPSGGFTGSVALTAAVTSSPAGAQNPPTLSFGSSSPVSITGSSAGTATLIISTTAATSATLAYPKRPRIPWYAAGGATLACILLFGIPARRRRWRAMLGMLMFLAALSTALVACGGGSSGTRGGGGTSNPGTTAGNYTVTVTGTSGATTATSTVTLTVQ